MTDLPGRFSFVYFEHRPLPQASFNSTSISHNGYSTNQNLATAKPFSLKKYTTKSKRVVRYLLFFAMSAMSAFAIVLPQHTTAEYMSMSMHGHTLRSPSYRSQRPRPTPIIEDYSNPNFDETYYHQYRTYSGRSSISSGSSKLKRAFTDKIRSLKGRKNSS